MDTTLRPDTPNIVETVQVSSSTDLADVLRSATEQGTPVIPVGGGTSLHTGNRTSEEYLGIDLRTMTGVREYHPTDLTVSFWGGTTLTEIQRVLGEHGQELPVDMVDVETATIGGMVATGFAGPRRLGAGTLKDLIIGCEYVRGDGLVAKAGGMLVKNVSGFEIPRLLHGSWGSLAVISAINLKVVPQPRGDITFLHYDESLASSLKAQTRVLRQHPGVTAAVTECLEDRWVLAVRVLGRRSALNAQVESMRHDLGSDTEVADGAARWHAYMRRWSDGADTIRIVASGPSAVIHSIAVSLEALEGIRGMSVSLGTGTLRLAVEPATLSYEEIEAHLTSSRTAWIIESAPASWVGNGSVWGAPRGDRALVSQIKAQFDPGGILNRGRLFV